MDGLWRAAVFALGLGVLTAISPCPLAANVLAMSFIGRRVQQPRRVFLAGLLYALGQVAAYVAVAALIVSAVLADHQISLFLARYVNKLFGPLLIVIGMFMLGMIPISFGGVSGAERWQKRAEKLGILGAFLLGVLFALAFCPTSAFYFFGNLLPVCLAQRSACLLPALFGLGAALPALLFAFLLAFAAHRVGSAYNKLAVFEKWARLVAGVCFICVGIYYTLIYIYGVSG